MNNKPIIIFDGICNLCEFSVRFIISNDKAGRFLFLPFQSEDIKNYLPNNLFLDNNSVILVDNGKVYYKSDAFLRICAEFDSYWKYLKYLKYIPRFIRDGIYGLISQNRYKYFGKKGDCLIPNQEIKDRFL